MTPTYQLKATKELTIGGEVIEKDTVVAVIETDIGLTRLINGLENGAIAREPLEDVVAAPATTAKPAPTAPTPFLRLSPAETPAPADPTPLPAK